MEKDEWVRPLHHIAPLFTTLKYEGAIYNIAQNVSDYIIYSIKAQTKGVSLMCPSTRLVLNEGDFLLTCLWLEGVFVFAAV